MEQRSCFCVLVDCSHTKRITIKKQSCEPALVLHFFSLRARPSGIPARWDAGASMQVSVSRAGSVSEARPPDGGWLGWKERGIFKDGSVSAVRPCFPGKGDSLHRVNGAAFPGSRRRGRAFILYSLLGAAAVPSPCPGPGSGLPRLVPRWDAGSALEPPGRRLPRPSCQLPPSFKVQRQLLREQGQAHAGGRRARAALRGAAVAPGPSLRGHLPCGHQTRFFGAAAWLLPEFSPVTHAFKFGSFTSPFSPGSRRPSPSPAGHRCFLRAKSLHSS